MHVPLMSDRAVAVDASKSASTVHAIPGRRGLIAIGALLLVGVALPLFVSLAAGAWDIPRNDDWAYRRIALDMARTGRFALDGITETMIVGQILISEPLVWIANQQPWGFAVAGALFAAAGVVGAFAVARSLLPVAGSAFAAALLLIFPGYLAYATSFMSDVPALAAQFFCIAIGAYALRSRPVPLLALLASAAVGVVGFSIREFAIAAPAAVLLAAVASNPRDGRRWALGAATAAVCIAIHAWRTGLPAQMPPVAPGLGTVDGGILGLTSVALVISPAAFSAAAVWRRHMRRLDVLIGASIGVGYVLARIIQWYRDGFIPLITLENVASRWGAPSGNYTAGGRAALFSDSVWLGINVAALASVVIVLAIGAGLLGAHARPIQTVAKRMFATIGSPLGILSLFCVLTVAGLCFFGLTRPLFDRYFWPLVPPLATLFLIRPLDHVPQETFWGSRNRPLMLGVLAYLAALSAISTAYMLNSFAFDTARWQAGQVLADRGMPANEIDAGYEWVGYHATAPLDLQVPQPGTTFYASWWPHMTRCGVVSSSSTPPLGGTLVDRINYQINLVVGPTATLYLYAMDAPGCAITH
jgi:hypothetical protein